MRNRQLLYLQYRPHCFRKRKTAVCGNVLRQSVSHALYMPKKAGNQWLADIGSSSASTGPVAYAMMEIRHAQGERKGRREDGLCRGGGSHNRPPTPAGAGGL